MRGCVSAKKKLRGWRLLEFQDELMLMLMLIMNATMIVTQTMRQMLTRAKSNLFSHSYSSVGHIVSCSQWIRHHASVTTTTNIKPASTPPPTPPVTSSSSSSLPRPRSARPTRRSPLDVESVEITSYSHALHGFTHVHQHATTVFGAIQG